MPTAFLDHEWERYETHVNQNQNPVLFLPKWDNLPEYKETDNKLLCPQMLTAQLDHEGEFIKHMWIGSIIPKWDNLPECNETDNKLLCPKMLNPWLDHKGESYKTHVNRPKCTFILKWDNLPEYNETNNKLLWPQMLTAWLYNELESYETHVNRVHNTKIGQFARRQWNQ